MAVAVFILAVTINVQATPSYEKDANFPADEYREFANNFTEHSSQIARVFNYLVAISKTMNQAFRLHSMAANT
jgi:hypothetical protein